MRKLLPANIKTATPFPLVNAVLDNLQDGNIFLDDAGGVLFIIHKAGFSYLTHNDRVDCFKTFGVLLESEEIPVYFHVYDPPLHLIDFCLEKSEIVNIKIRKRIQLKFKDAKLKLAGGSLPEKYTIQQINSDNFNKLSIFNLLLERKFWKSKEDFEENSFGFCVFNEADLPISICYAACIAQNTAEIDVATLPEYQKRGLANIAVTAFVNHCIQHKITANWDCFEDNYGSLKTAENVGFSYIMTYPFLSIFNQSRKS